MPLHATWAACAASIARCLTATTPALADWMFGAAREAGSFDGGGWFRLNANLGIEAPGGVAFLAPQGGDHRYRAEPPAGVERAGLPLVPPVPRGRLLTEAEAFLRDARVLAEGRGIRINGGRIPIEPTADAVAAAGGAVAVLEAALAVTAPAAVSALLREAALGFLRGVGRDGPAALEATTVAGAELRARCGAHAPLWALFQLRAGVGSRLLAGSPPAAVLFKLFDPFGPGAEADSAVRKGVADLVEAGQGEAVAEVAGALLARAEAARERALDSRSVVAHGTALHAAAGDAWAAAALEAALGRTGTAATDLALRATHALVVDALNLGSGAILLRHQAQIAADGPARADELIEAGWFYPRALRDTLLAQTA